MTDTASAPLNPPQAAPETFTPEPIQAPEAAPEAQGTHVAEPTPTAPAVSLPAFDIVHQEEDDSTKTPAELASATKPKYLTIGDKLYCQTPDGEIVLPLRFKTKLLREVNELSTLDDMAQLYWLLNAIGDKATVDAMDELDVFDTLGIVGAYFQEFEARSKAAMGESSGSLGS